MSDVNISRVYLLNVPLESDYKHTFYFSSKSEQENYFSSKAVKSYTDFSYMRKDSILRIPAPYDEVIKCNYVMYQNTAFSNKWFYAFIVGYEYKNEDLTDILISTDVMQTWMFDYEVKPSFVEREHVDDDTIGLHTVPENVEMGEYVCKQKDIDTIGWDLAVVFAVTETPDGDSAYAYYDGLFSSLTYYAFKIGGDSITKIREFTDNYTTKPDAIQSVFFYPHLMLKFIGGEGWQAYRVHAGLTPNNYSIVLARSIREAFSDNENYSYITDKPKNNKLFTFPYVYLVGSNSNGASAIYRYEDFELNSDGLIEFKVVSCICPGGSIRMIPLDYKGIHENDEEGLNLGKFPIGNWSSDAFTNWLTQNAVNIGVNVAGGGVQALSGVGGILGGVAGIIGGVGALASGAGAPFGVAGIVGGAGSIVNGVGSSASGLLAIGNQMGQIYQASFMPEQAHGNINCGDVITASEKNRFTFYHMRIKPEYMSIIDEYFSTYGYKINRVKVPNKNHREQWWFTKTIDVNIEGQIPIVDKQVIKTIYNNGITFWKNPANIKKYNLSNKII